MQALRIIKACIISCGGHTNTEVRSKITPGLRGLLLLILSIVVGIFRVPYHFYS
jgi:hypothetical protein